jgi:hypothetical protein
MSSLERIEEDEVSNHHLDVPFRVSGVKFSFTNPLAS